MARPALATVDDLEILLGDSVPDADQAEARLGQASAIVRAFARQTWLNDDNDLENVPDDIPGVVTAMVERASRNPDGATQESAGPFSRSFGPDAASRLYLTANEKSVIRAGVGSTGIGTLSTSGGDLETAQVTDDAGWAGDIEWDDPFANQSPP